MDTTRYSNLRGGIIYKATGLQSVTVRAWATGDRPLKIGTVVPGGRPRYSLADAARLLTMEQLTFRLGVTASVAIKTVNAIPFEEYTAKVLADLAGTNQVDREPEWFFTIQDQHRPMPSVASADEVTARTLLNCNLVIEAKSMINFARYRLDQALAGERAETDD